MASDPPRSAGASPVPWSTSPSVGWSTLKLFGRGEFYGKGWGASLVEEFFLMEFGSHQLCLCFDCSCGCEFGAEVVHETPATQPFVGVWGGVGAAWPGVASLATITPLLFLLGGFLVWLCVGVLGESKLLVEVASSATITLFCFHLGRAVAAWVVAVGREREPGRILCSILG
uniref:Uncharacterized protein n=1 Tax=Oryza punctata TaxID=4537 RepID=A0A0E0LZS4_ORYPU